MMQKVLNVMVDRRQAVSLKKGNKIHVTAALSYSPNFSRRSGAWRNRGKRVPRTRVESRDLGAENKAVTDTTFIRFRGL